MSVSVLNAPQGFLEALLPLPEGASLVDFSKTGLDLQVLFVAKKTELVAKLSPMIRSMTVTGGLWVCYGDSADPVSGVTEDFVRLAAIEMGLVDTKRVLLGPDWRALKLQWRPKGPRPEIPQARA
jgi:hypothetical protein